MWYKVNIKVLKDNVTIEGIALFHTLDEVIKKDCDYVQSFNITKISDE